MVYGWPCSHYFDKFLSNHSQICIKNVMSLPFYFARLSYFRWLAQHFNANKFSSEYLMCGVLCAPFHRHNRHNCLRNRECSSFIFFFPTCKYVDSFSRKSRIRNSSKRKQKRRQKKLGKLDATKSVGLFFVWIFFYDFFFTAISQWTALFCEREKKKPLMSTIIG